MDKVLLVIIILLLFMLIVSPYDAQLVISRTKLLISHHMFRISGGLILQDSFPLKIVKLECYYISPTYNILFHKIQEYEHFENFAKLIP